MRGTVKIFFRPKGYGFIIPETEGPDVRFHFTHITDLATRRSIDVGSQVTFQMQHGDKGSYATHVKVEVPFTWVDLPENCSHRVAIRCDLDGAVAVFQNRGDAAAWREVKREEVRKCLAN